MEYQNALCGWTDHGIGQRIYGRHKDIKVMLEELSKVNYPIQKELNWSWRRTGGKPMIWAERSARSRSVTAPSVFDVWLLRTVGKMTAFIQLLPIRAIRCCRRHGICRWLTKWAELWRTTVLSIMWMFFWDLV